MSAPNGNQFWKLRNKHGRDRLFESPELLLKSAYEYFQWCDDNPWTKIETTTRIVKKIPMSDEKVIPTARPYTISGLCLYLDCNTQYFSQFKKNLTESDIDKDFSLVITRIEDIIYTQKFEGAAVGAFNANIIARDLGLSDRQETNNKTELNITVQDEYTKDELNKLINEND